MHQQFKNMTLEIQRTIKNRQQQRHPFTDIRLSHRKQLPMGFLDGILLQVGQNEQQAIFRTRQRAIGLRDRAITFPKIAIQGVAGKIALHCGGESGE